tara:strand:+ start:285 stop:485 length:201 start_codon:yes stop_codon:yes gene_type:complete
MADRFFKKAKNKFKIGYSDKIFKYDYTRHKIEDLENRFEECDKNGNPVKAVAKKTTKKTTKKKETK